MSLSIRRLLSGSWLRVLSMVLSAFVGFAMTPFVIGILGDRLYGFWALMLSFLSYYGLFDLGLSAAVIRHVSASLGSRDERECNHIINTALMIYVGLGLIVLCVTFGLAAAASSIIEHPDDASLAWRVIIILGSGAAIALPAKVFVGVLASYLRFDVLSGLSLLSLFLRTSLTVFALLSGYKVLALAFIAALSGLPEMILSIYFAKRCCPTFLLSPAFWHRESARKLFSYGGYVLIAQAGDLFRFNIDGFVIARFVSLAAVTHYNIASVMVQHFLNLMVALMGVIQPVFGRLDGENNVDAMRHTFFIATRMSIFSASFVAFGLIGWGSPFIHRWMGPEYLDAYPCLVILVCGWLFDLWQIPSVSLLYATSKHRFYAVANAVEGGCNLLLSIALVEYWGIVGVAVGTLIPMTIIRLGVQPLYLCRCTSIPYRDYMVVLVKAIQVASIALIGPLILSMQFVAPDYLSLALWGFGSLLYYVLVIAVFGLTKQERMALSEAVSIKLLSKDRLTIESGR